MFKLATGNPARRITRNRLGLELLPRNPCPTAAIPNDDPVESRELARPARDGLMRRAIESFGMMRALIVAPMALYLAIGRSAEAEGVSSRVCQAMQAAVPNWTRSHEKCVQQFDSNFLRARTNGFDPPAGAACWYLLYRDLSREDRPIDRNLTKEERERAVIACYKAAGIACSRGGRPGHCA